MTVLTWKHQTLIQALIGRGPLKEKEFHAMFNGVTGRNPGAHRKMFDDYLLAINKELSYLHFELRACRDQYDGHVFYGVVNNISDEQSKLGTKYSVPQIAFYKGVIEAIVQDGTASGSISNFDALNIRLENQIPTEVGSESQSNQSHVPPAFRNFTMSHKEKTLNELVLDKWLCLTSDGNIGLGTRSLLDLRSWFRNADVPSCEVCNEAGVKAEVCPNDDCTVRIHAYCLKTLYSRKGEKVCPGCSNHWPFHVPKAEAVETEEQPSEPTQSQPPSGRSRRQSAVEPKRKRLHVSKSEDPDSAGCSSSQASLLDNDQRRVTRRSSRLR